jgi:hypothetical protein
MLDYNALAALNECVDVTFGRSGIREAGHGIHCTIKNGMNEGEHILEVRYETILTCQPYNQDTACREHDDVSIKALNEEISRIKSDFREKTGITLNAKKGDHRSHFEVHSWNPGMLRGRYTNTIQYFVK